MKRWAMKEPLWDWRVCLCEVQMGADAQNPLVRSFVREDRTFTSCSPSCEPSRTSHRHGPEGWHPLAPTSSRLRRERHTHRQSASPWPLCATHSSTQNRSPVNITHTHTHTHVGFCGLWGLSIGVMVFILNKLCVLLPYTNPTPKLSPHRRLCASLDFQKNTI